MTIFVVSVAGGVIANFISYFVISGLQKPRTAIVERRDRVVTVEKTRVRGPLNYERVHEKTVIRDSHFVVPKNERVRLRIPISLISAVIVFGALLWALLLN